VGDEVAAAVLRGDDAPLEAADRALAHWARALTRDPNATGAAEVQALRDAGFDDPQIAAPTLYVALRIAFSTVNDALGARPDRDLVEGAPLRCGRPSPTDAHRRAVGDLLAVGASLDCLVQPTVPRGQERPSEHAPFWGVPDGFCGHRHRHRLSARLCASSGWRRGESNP
jgi:hypothetical protein